MKTGSTKVSNFAVTVGKWYLYVNVGGKWVSVGKLHMPSVVWIKL